MNLQTILNIYSSHAHIELELGLFFFWIQMKKFFIVGRNTTTPTITIQREDKCKLNQNTKLQR
jgi:hypothetical protein